MALIGADRPQRYAKTARVLWGKRQKKSFCASKNSNHRLFRAARAAAGWTIA